MIGRFATAGRALASRSVQPSSSYSVRVLTCRYAQTAIDEEVESEATMTAAEYRSEHTIKVSKDCPEPFQRFEDCDFPHPLQKALEAQGFAAPSPIQAQSWPIAREGQDIVSVAKTGSGKTLGFLVPAIEQIMQKKANGSAAPRGRYNVCQPSCIVLAPTRELAQQINAEAKKICSRLGIHTAVLFGGASKNTQLSELRRHPDIIVATPGRLNDFMNPQSGFPAAIDASATSYTVLDEADRMLDMGFEPQIKDILDKCPKAGERQTLMFTATWPKKVQSVARSFTGQNVEHVMIGDANEKLTASASIKQIVHILREDEKLTKLKEVLSELQPKDQVMIFSSTKRVCDDIDWHLRREGVRTAGAIHGDKSQYQRDRVLSDFRQGRGQVLVATDVAARGIDVPNVKAVIVFDFPQNTEDYIHRIGRTGRAGKTGVSHAFLTEACAAQTPELEQIMKDSGNEISEELAAIVRAQKAPVWSQRTMDRGNKKGGNRGGRSSGSGGYNSRNGGDKYGGRGGYNSRNGGGDRSSYGGDRSSYGGYSSSGGYENRSSGYQSGRRGGKDRYDPFSDSGSSGSSRRWEDDYN